jgi:anhydro-N-acetylmuramic acid kinase
MSGTSLDAIDAVLLQCGDNIQLIHHYSHPIPAPLRRDILALCQPGDNEIDRAGNVHIALGHVFADATLALIEQAGVTAADICAIGCHGQTIRHRPTNTFSVQIGSADVLAVRTGIAVVSDFRNRDMALGGQGAPLVPAFHHALWGQLPRCAIVNIGGMANFTFIADGRIVTGYDSGPGNVLMDGWIQQQRKQHFDDDGAWASSGEVLADLLAAMLDDPYFSMPAPKSTGRELFNQQWLEQHLAQASQNARPEDIQATLLELTAASIATQLTPLQPAQVLVCGGGARNSALMARLQQLLNQATVSSTDQAGLAADWVEGAAFAWLAWARLNGVTGNATQVTGAREEAVLGALYLP